MSTRSRRATVTALFAAAVLTAPLAAQSCNLLALEPSSTTTATLWDVNKITGAASNPRPIVTTPARAPTEMAFGLNGVLYGVSMGSLGDTPPGGKLWTINPATGATTFVADLTIPLTVEGDLAIDPLSGALYAITGIGDLFTIDTSTGVGTLIGNLAWSDYSGLCFDENGELWAWDNFTQSLYHLDKNTAAILGQVPVSPSPGGSVAGLAFDATAGDLVLGAGTPGPKVGAVDRVTGLFTLAGPMTGMGGCYSIEIDSSSCATVTSDGTGCVTRFASFYEPMTATAMDLAGKKVVATWNGNGYQVKTLPGSGWTLSSSAVQVPLADDDSITFGNYGLCIGSNGWVARGPANSLTPTPTSALLLNQPCEQISAWTDLDPSDPASGFVYYDEPSPGVARITYDGVIAPGNYDPNWIQIVWNVGTGDWSIEFGALALTNPQPWLVGYSPAGPNLDPGVDDVSTFGAPVHLLSMFDVLPLTIAPVGRPVQQNVAVQFDALATNVEPTALLLLGVIGWTDPHVPLSFLGLPNDCWLHASLDVWCAPVWFPAATQQWNVLTLPALPPSLNGVGFHTQAFTFDANGLGPTTRTSNGLKCKIGLF
ncbi:MAG: hypothetical protein H6835_14000 [Planctomycetes bacterium]|nr:hypothetical protein [Planctomycetota bacterium]